MRFFVEIPTDLVDRLQDQARTAHRPPRYHLEWLIRQVLQAPSGAVPTPSTEDTTHPPQED